MVLPVAVVLLLSGLPRSGYAQVPRLLNYQATLTDGTIPVEGPVTVDVAFFTEETGGTPLGTWSETYEDVLIQQGRLRLLLGSQTPLPDPVLEEAASLFLQITVDGTAFPRLRVASTAFALRAQVAEAVADGVVTADALVNEAVTTRTLAPGAVTASRVRPGELVTSLNGLRDDVQFVAGDNISIESDPEDGTITIEADDDKSSRRWKTDIVPLDGALGLVQQLRGVRYRWTETGTPDLGLIAEEVGAVVPEVVTYAPNGVDAETVNYARLVTLLVEAVKEQQAQITADRVRLQQMEARLEALETRRSTP